MNVSYRVSYRFWVIAICMMSFFAACGIPDPSTEQNTNTNGTTRTTSESSQATGTSKSNTETAKPSCSTSADCGNGFLCEAGSCKKVPCSQKTEVCNGIDDNCDGTVDEGTLCGTGEACIQGTCQKPPTPPTPPSCRTSAECAAGETCQQGSCQKSPTPGCRSHSDCSTGETCENGTCQGQSTRGCRSNTECGQDEECVRYTCIKKVPGPCQSDRDCGSNQICGRGVCMDRPKELCNGVDDNGDGQIDETGCSGSCKFPMELSFTAHDYSVYLKLNEENGSCDPQNNSSALVFGSSHTGRYVGNGGNWKLVSTSHGKLYGGSVLMDIPFNQRIVLGIKSPKGRTFAVIFVWAGSVSVLAVQG